MVSGVEDSRTAVAREAGLGCKGPGEMVGDAGLHLECRRSLPRWQSVKIRFAVVPQGWTAARTVREAAGRAEKRGWGGGGLNGSLEELEGPRTAQPAASRSLAGSRARPWRAEGDRFWITLEEELTLDIHSRYLLHTYMDTAT